MCLPNEKRSKIDRVIDLLTQIRNNTSPVPETDKQPPEEPKKQFQYTFRSGHDPRWYDEGTGPCPHLKLGEAFETVRWRQVDPESGKPILFDKGKAEPTIPEFPTWEYQMTGSSVWYLEGTGPRCHLSRGETDLRGVTWGIREKRLGAVDTKTEEAKSHYRVLLTDDQLVKLINNKTVIVGDVHINRMPARDISHSRY